MKKIRKTLSYWAVVLSLLIGLVPQSGPMASGIQPVFNSSRKVSPRSPSIPLESAAKHKLSASYGKLPLSFEPNQGQADSQVQFLSHGNGYTLFLTSGEAVLALHKPQANPNSKFSKPKYGKKGQKFISPSAAVPQTPPVALRMKLEGAQAGISFQSLEQLPGISNYLIGNDRSKWHTHIPQFAKVQAQEIYPGVDMVYYGNQGHLEYDFVVKPGADPKSIHLEYEGAKNATVNAQGDLELEIEGGQVTFRSPTVYQEREGQRNPVEGHYQMEKNSGIRFEVKDYDKTKPLIIDPTLDYSTDFGGNAIAVDGNGDAYVAGQTTSNNFPTTSGAFQTGFPNSNATAFVFELNPAGSALIYCTYLGGNGGSSGTGDAALAIAVDRNGDAYVTGSTTSTNFPTSPGALQTTIPNTNQSAFMTELNPSGTGLVYSTYLGGNNYDQGNSIALDGSGNAYVTGYTLSTNFPTTSGSFQTTSSGGQIVFVTELNPSASGSAQLAYSSYLGGGDIDQANGITVDGKGNIYVTGSTQSTNFPTTSGAFQFIYPTGGFIGCHAFVTELNPTQVGLVYSTFLGGENTNSGSGGGVTDVGNAIAVDGNGDAYVTGYTNSYDFPTTSGAFQTTDPNPDSTAFVAELNPTGTGLVYSTYLGGSSYEMGYSIAVDGSGDAYVTGTTWSTDFPLTPDALQTTHTNVLDLIFLTELNPVGTALVYSTYFGGESLYDDSWGESIALDGSGGIYLAGYNLSSDFPTTPGAYQAPCSFCGDSDFVAKFDASVFYTPTPTSNTLSPTFTATATPSPTLSPSSSPTPLPTSTPSSSPTPSASSTPTNSPASQPSNTPTNSPTLTATDTPLAIASPSPSPTFSATLTPTASPTSQPSNTVTNTPTLTATNITLSTSTPSNTPTPTATATGTPTLLLTPSPTATPSLIGGGFSATLYPNPANNSTVSIYLTGLDSPSDITVQVITTSFRKIQQTTFSKVVPGSSLNLALSDQMGNPFANGLYYVVVNLTNRGPRAITKLLILR